MSLQLRRGLEADRTTIVPAAGELLYVTDTKKLYVGDGATSGGTAVSVGGSGGGGQNYAPWSRNTEWLTLPTLTDTDQRFAGLHAVEEDGNWVALTATTSVGQYRVDWGDGTVDLVDSGVQAQHIYDFTNTALNGSLTTSGYKQAIVSVTPVSGNFLTFSLGVRHSAGPATLYSSGWLDIAYAGQNTTSFTTVGQIQARRLEQSTILKNDVTNWTSCYQNCYKLSNIVSHYTDSGTNFDQMFYNCSSLQTIPLLNTGLGTNFTQMFYNCSSLQTIPLLNTGLGTIFAQMFYDCSSLQTIPLLNTAAGTNFTQMFSFCSSLQTIPLLNTGLGTNFDQMFYNCSSLQTIPLLNTAAGTIFAQMFYNCSSLQTIPLLNTAAGTNFGSMFSYCSSLQTIPLLNTAAGTNFTQMFYNCSSLQTIPLLNTGLGTNFTQMFSFCSSLQTIPLLNTAAGTIFAQMFYNCSSLKKISAQSFRYSFDVSPALLTLTQLNSVYTNLPDIGTAVTFQDTGDTITLANHGLVNGKIIKFSVITTTTGIAVNTNYYVVNSTANTFQVSTTSGGTALALTTDGTGYIAGKLVTLQDTGDTVTLANHGYTAKQPITFSVVNTTTGITAATQYYVINPTTNTFQVSTTSGGTALALTTNGTAIAYGSTTITASTFSKTGSTPTIAQNKGWIVL
jgi:hypothetical protein